VRRLRRFGSCVIVAATLILLPANSAFGQSNPTSAALCQRNPNFCMAVIGQARTSTTEREVGRFITSITNANAQYGEHGIHECDNELTPSIQVTCILASSDTRKYLTKIENDFRASKLFRKVKTRIPMP
jgi:hypothetical protein